MNYLRALCISTLMMLGSYTYSYAGQPDLSDPVLTIMPSIRAANAIYFHQVRQIETYREIDSLRTQQIRSLEAALFYSTRENKLLVQITQHDERMITTMELALRECRRKNTILYSALSGLAAFQIYLLFK